MLPVRPASLYSPTTLAWHHFWLHWLVGLALLVVAVALGEGAATATVASYSLFGAIFLGIPAAVVGMVRVPLMRELFERARTWHGSAGARLARLLAWSALVFLGPAVALVALGLLWNRQDAKWENVSTGLAFYFGVSLPWLLGAVGASWALRRRLWSTPLPDAAPATAPETTQ